MEQVRTEMDQITLNSDLCCDALVIPGAALEKCLREANESQLKIYLYLLKNGVSTLLPAGTPPAEALG